MVVSCVGDVYSSLMAQVKQLWLLYDSAVSTAVLKTLSELGYAEASRPVNPLMKGYWFVESPTPLLTVITLYLAIVCTGRAMTKPLSVTRPHKRDSVNKET